MAQRFVSVWFRHLLTDWHCRRDQSLCEKPFVLCGQDRGRLVVTAANFKAEQAGIDIGMVVADARTLEPNIEVIDEQLELAEKLLNILADWCVRYTPVVSVDLPNGLLLDITGCSHLFKKDEHGLLKDLITRLRGFGYDARGAIADTIGAAWAVARYERENPISAIGQAKEAIAHLPPVALRVDAKAVKTLKALGIKRIDEIYSKPSRELKRRFGQGFYLRLEQAVGNFQEFINPKPYVFPYVEQLPCRDVIQTIEGIEKATRILLFLMCRRLRLEQNGIRKVVLECLRVDGKIEAVEVGTNKPSNRRGHLFRLFKGKLGNIEPALGIELFILKAIQVEDIHEYQNALIEDMGSRTSDAILETLDTIAGRLGAKFIYRLLPKEYYLPERSYIKTYNLEAEPETGWLQKRRPIFLFEKCEEIQAVAMVPDHPPRSFRWRGKHYAVTKAESAERLERASWVTKKPFRDYFLLEVEGGARYWVFRSGPYDADTPPRWYLHGAFA